MSLCFSSLKVPRCMSNARSSLLLSFYSSTLMAFLCVHVSYSLHCKCLCQAKIIFGCAGVCIPLFLEGLLKGHVYLPFSLFQVCKRIILRGKPSPMLNATVLSQRLQFCRITAASLFAVRFTQLSTVSINQVNI